MLQIAMADYQGNRIGITSLIAVYQELLSHQIQLGRSMATLASTLAQVERLAAQPVDHPDGHMLTR